MVISYARDVSHCDISPYVKEVTISKIIPAENSDNLECIIVEEMGWRFISQKGLHQIGKKVFVIPAESVLPEILAEELNITNYLSRGKVKVVKLRGNISEGLIVDKEKVLKYLPYIMKWEDPPELFMEQLFPSEKNTLVGKILSFHFRRNVPNIFKQLFHVNNNILNDTTLLKEGEEINYSEKIHGTQFRCGRLENPKSKSFEDFVGTHNSTLFNPYDPIPLWLKYFVIFINFIRKFISKRKAINLDLEPSIYWKVYSKLLKTKIEPGLVYYGELYGGKVQHLNYGLKIGEETIRIFAIRDKNRLWSPEEIIEHCKEREIPVVQIHTTTFKSIDQLRELADSPSEITNKHLREGIVIIPKKYSISFSNYIKCLGFSYLSSKNRTERH